MKKHFSIVLLCAVLLICTSLPAFAASPKIVDNAELLTQEQQNLLEKKAQAITEDYQMDIAIVTVWGLDGKTSTAYADDYFDYNGYGVGNSYSGVLLLLSLEHRDWAITTCGETMDALTDNGIQSVFSRIAPYLAVDDYYHAFDTYLDALIPYLKSYRAGDPLDVYTDDLGGPVYTPGITDGASQNDTAYTSQWYGKKVVVAFLIGVAVAVIVLLIMRSKMNTARAQRGAASYMNSGSYDLRTQHDWFLYSRINKVRRQQSSSGGRSVHSSSSGRSHGGGHGKF